MRLFTLSLLMLFLSIANIRAQDNSTHLNYKVFTVKRASMTHDPNMPAGNESLRWVVNTSTLIYGQKDAILVDVYLTTEQSEKLVKWIKESGKKLKAVYLTHPHADHIYGAQMVKDAFSSVKVIALASSMSDFVKQIDSTHLDLWNKLFPGQIDQKLLLPEAMQGNELELEGQKLIAENVGYSDADNSSFLYVPSIGLVVAGDIVYNGIHPYLAETTVETRKQWVAALDKIAALHPKFVVAGHKIPENSDSPSNIQATRKYLLDFETLNKETHTTLELYNKMLKRYPDRVNPGSLWGGAKNAKSNQ